VKLYGCVVTYRWQAESTGSSSLLDGESITCAGNSHLAFCLRQAKQLRLAWERLVPHEENNIFNNTPRQNPYARSLSPRVTTGKGGDGYEGIMILSGTTLESRGFPPVALRSVKFAVVGARLAPLRDSCNQEGITPLNFQNTPHVFRSGYKFVNQSATCARKALSSVVTKRHMHMHLSIGMTVDDSPLF
jgi:hypothetical protein